MIQSAKSVLDYLRPIFWESCPVWVEKNIDLSLDNTCDMGGLVDLNYTPYLREPLTFWEREFRSKMTLVGVEQTGKSSVWKWGLLFKHNHSPQPTLVVYPSDADAADTNQDSFEPLMSGIPQMSLELDRPKVKRKDCYKFSAGPIYFQGGGADIISKPQGVVIGDEADFWMQHFEQVDNVKNMDKRTRTFRNALRVLVCSINQKKAKKSIIWNEFKKFSSQGYWHLGCMKCNALTMRSADVHNMQWELDEDENIIQESIRLICPKCERKHEEKEKREMGIHGGYIHTHPELIRDHVGYQWGAIASQMPGLDWLEIARTQMNSGRSANFEDQLLFWNSYRGIPFDMKASNPMKQQLTERQIPLPDPKIIENVFMCADTQDDCFYYRIRAIDSDKNMYSLTPAIKAITFEELDKAWQAEYLGIKPIMGIIDVGGHRPEEVEKWVANKKNFYGYRGDPRVAKEYDYVDGKPKVLRANPYPYQVQLLYYMYIQKNRANNYWYLHPEETDEYFDMMLDVKSPKKHATRDTEFKDWKPSSGNDHCFDCEKLFFLILKVAKNKLTPAEWRLGKIKDYIRVVRPPASAPPPMKSPFGSGGVRMF